MFLFDCSCCCNHRSQFLWDLIDQIREELLRKHCPGWTTGCQKKWKFSGCHFIHIMMCFRNCSDIRSKSNLICLWKSEFFKSCFEVSYINIRSKLTNKCRCYLSHNLFSFWKCTSQLEDLRLVRDRTKRAAYHTHSAGNTFVSINISTS